MTLLPLSNIFKVAATKIWGQQALEFRLMYLFKIRKCAFVNNGGYTNVGEGQK